MKYYKALSIGILIFLVLSLTNESEGSAKVEQVPWEPQIAVVWPHDGKGNPTSIEESRMVNVAIWPRNKVSCDQPPREPVSLSLAKDNEPREPVPYGRMIQQTIDGLAFPALLFENIPADLTGDPTRRYAIFSLGVNPSNIWVHAADPRTILPQPIIPEGIGKVGGGNIPVDARIQVVTPHDKRGQPAPVETAPSVNIGVDLFQFNTLKSLPVDTNLSSSIPALYISEGNSPLQKSNIQSKKIIYTVGDQVYPRWVFENVPVNPDKQTNFLVSSMLSTSNVWTHAKDGRTFLPEPELPPA